MIKLFRFLVLLSFTVMLTLISGCGSSNMALNSAQKTSELQPGMSYDQVEALLGKPRSSQMINDKWIARWVLQEMWVGYVPYDMVFNPKTKELISWSQNEKDYQQSQENLKAIAGTIEEAEAASNSAAGKGNASATGPNDEVLMRQFAVKLYHFSAVGGGQTGGSERIVHLCPNGKFHEASESGYSGEGWGTAGQGGNHGTWRITGNMQEGTITFVYSGGEAWEYRYTRVAGDYVSIGSTKYGINGTPDCQ